MRIPFYLRLPAFTLGLMLAFTSCQNEDSNPATQLDDSNETVQETGLTAALEDSDEVVLMGFQRQGFSDRSTISLGEDLCDRTAINWLPDQKKMIIDFGEGCVSPRGIFRKGKIIVTYTGRYWTPGSVITTTFENYFVDGKKIEGTRIVKNEGFNDNEKYFTFHTLVKDGKITWEDNTFRSFEARHQKRIYLPNGDRGITYSTTGGSKGVNRAGKAYKSLIEEALVNTERCIKSGIKIPSKGIIKIEIESRNPILVDFGTGTCDREVTIRIGDRSKIVSLPRG